MFVPRKGKRTVSQMASAGLTLGRRILESVDIEPESCFVAMPFSEEFEERYALFYCPLIRSAGLRPIRGWGGLTLEKYQALLRLLIEKCGVLLGELSGANPNVLYEIGIAHAFGHPTILLFDRSDKDTVRAVSNLASYIRLPYSSDGPSWWKTAVARNVERIRRYRLTG